jgi:hypothetical protein
MSRYECKTCEVPIGTSLAAAMTTESKRTYFVSLEFSKECSVFINGKEFASGVLINATTNTYNNTLFEVIDNTFIDESTHPKLLKFLKGKQEYNWTVEGDDEITVKYTYILDTKSSKKKRKPKPKPQNKDETPEQKAERDANISKWEYKQTELANKIWDQVQGSFENEEFIKLDEHTQLKYYQNKFSNFNRQHPLCIRYMVEMRKFRTKAFTRYIKKVSSSKAGDPKEFLERQADYVVLLWKEVNTHYSAKQAKKVWEDAYHLVERESDVFKEMQDTAENIAEKIDSKYNNELKQELKTQIESIPQEKLLQNDYRLRTNTELHLIDKINKINKINNNEDTSYSSDEDTIDFGPPTKNWKFFAE